jgi:hypothetical protein
MNPHQDHGATGVPEAALAVGPKHKDRRHFAYEEDADEPASRIENEPTEIEMERPVDETEPVERIENQDDDAPPVFDD